MDNLSDWAKAEIERRKAVLMHHLDPRNPVKEKVVATWGLIIVSVLLIAAAGLFAMMLMSSSS